MYKTAQLMLFQKFSFSCSLIPMISKLPPFTEDSQTDVVAAQPFSTLMKPTNAQANVETESNDCILIKSRLFSREGIVITVHLGGE
jgi:hypothetical protein